MVCLKGPMGSRGLTAAGSQRAPFDTLLYSSDGLGGRQVGADERRGTKQALTLQVLRVGCGGTGQQCVLASLRVAQLFLLSDEVVHLVVTGGDEGSGW